MTEAQEQVTAQDAQNQARPYWREQLLSVEDALETVLNRTQLALSEPVGILESFGRVLAQDVASDIDISPFDNSAMDGFALRFEDFEATAATPNTSPLLTLKIVGVIGAGEVYSPTLASGEALRIMTGAPVPNGADTIVKIEETEVHGVSQQHPEGKSVSFTKLPRRGDHVRQKAEEACKGEVLLRRGERINSAGAGLLAATGNATVLVYRRPRVAIISTGSELVDVTTVPGPGQIRNSNSYSLAAAVIDAGGIPEIRPSIADSREALASALLEALRDHDFVITSGGAAEGDFDFITPVVREQGELFFNKVNMKPGKAQTFGIINGKPIFGLPGNPGAASVGFEVLIRPALLKMQGFSTLTRPLTKAVLKQDVRKKDEMRRFYLRARLERDANDSYQVTPEANQSSALLGALNRSNCLMIVPEGSKALAAGDVVECLRLDIEEGVL